MSLRCSLAPCNCPAPGCVWRSCSSLLHNSSPRLTSYKSPPRDSSFRPSGALQAKLSCHLFYRFSAKKNTFSHLICMKGSHYFQLFNLINSNNLGAMFELQRTRFLCKLTCWWATGGPVLGHSCRRHGEGGLWPEGSWGHLAPWAEAGEGHLGKEREGGLCAMLCSVPRKRSGTGSKRNRWANSRGLKRWVLWTPRSSRRKTAKLSR